MSIHKSLPARLLATHLVLLGMTGACAALAEDAASPGSRFDTEAGPVDTSITTQPPVHATRGVKARATRKSAIAHSQLTSSTHWQVSMPKGKIGGVRNAIGSQVRPAPNINIPAREQRGNDIAAKADSVPNAGSDTVNTATHRELFVPLQRGAMAPRDPHINTTMNRLIISGRDMVRPGFGASLIGGAAKSNPGVIAGNDFRSKHSASQ